MTGVRYDVEALDDPLVTLAIDLACDAWREPSYWQVVATLHRAPLDPTFASVAPLLDDPRERVRAFAVDVLRGLGRDLDEGHWKRAVAARTSKLLLRLASTDRTVRVLATIADAFGDAPPDEHTSAGLALLARSEHARVRMAVAQSLQSRTDPDAVALLVALSADRESGIRAWSTFALGDLCDARGDPFDTPAIRDALFARIDDPHEETRTEAVAALARRRDERVVPVVLAALHEGPPWDRAISAAHDLADPRLVDALRALRARAERPSALSIAGYRSAALDAAIAACSNDEK